MGWSITKRATKSGMNFRVRYRSKNIPMFSITFDDYDAACRFIEEKEGEFTQNPEKFFIWRATLRTEMRRKGIKVENNIIAPRLHIPFA